MDFSHSNNTWDSLTPEEKNHQLFLRQKNTLDLFLERGAISQAEYDSISQAEYDRSLHGLMEKMGEHP